MTSPTTYEEVQKLYPEALGQIEKAKAISKAKNAGEPLSKFNFSYDYCVAVKGYSFAEVVGWYG